MQKPGRSKSSPRHTNAFERHIRRAFVLRARCLRLYIIRNKKLANDRQNLAQVEKIPGMNRKKTLLADLPHTQHSKANRMCVHLLSGLLDCGQRSYLKRSPIQSHVAMESAPASLPNMSMEEGVLGSVYEGQLRRD